MAVILGCDRGHPASLPHVTLTLLVPHPHTQHLAHVQLLTLGTTPTAVDRKGGGIHARVRDPVSLHTPMQPEAFAPRFIATDHGSRVRQPQTASGLGDVVEHALLLPRRHGALARLLTMARRAAELPGFFTQCKGHKQDAL